MLSRTTRFGNPREAVRDALLGMAQKDVVRFINRYMKSLFVYNSDDLIDEPVDTLVPGPPLADPRIAPRGLPRRPQNRSIGLELELSGEDRYRAAFPANIRMLHIDTGNVLLDHGGA